MSSYKNRSCYNSQFFIKEFIDKEKLISKIFRNIESKTKIIEKYKNKFYNTNNISESIVLGKLEFLEILNDFEEIISQSLQGIRSLFAEIQNLKEKKEIKDKLLKRRNNKTKNNSLNKEKSYSAYLNKCANKKENQNEKILKEKKESFYMNFYSHKNNNENCKANNFTKLYYKKNSHYLGKNNSNIMRNKKIFDNISIKNNTNNINENRIEAENNIFNSMRDNIVFDNDLELMNDKESQNQNQNKSSLLINNDYNYFNNTKGAGFRKILRLELKNKEKNDKANKNEKINSMSQRYEVELENTEKEKKEKLEVEVKFPIRQGIKRNCKNRSEQLESSKSELIHRFNYALNKNEIIEKIKKDTKLKYYFAKKYGENIFENFLNKIWKNKLNLNEIYRELKIITKTIQFEEKSNQK